MRRTGACWQTRSAGLIRRKHLMSPAFASHLGASPCDFRLRAEATNCAIRFQITLASGSTNEMTAPEHAVATVLELLQAVAARGPTARARDLLPLSISPGDGTAKSAHAAAEPIGTHALRDGNAAIGVGQIGRASCRER